MAGKRQKHPSTLQGHRPRPNLVALPALRRLPAPPLPRLPDAQTWHRLTRARWREMWAGDVAGTWDRKGELGPLYRYILTFDRWLQYDELVRKAPIVKGSMGQLRENPLATRLSVLNAELGRFEEKYGLTPSDRMRLGIELGGAAQGLKTAADLLAEQAGPADDYSVPDGWEVELGGR